MKNYDFELSLRKELYYEITGKIKHLKKMSDIALEYAYSEFESLSKITGFFVTRTYKKFEKEIYKANNELIEIKNDYENNVIDDWEFVQSYQESFKDLEEIILSIADWFKDCFEELTFSYLILPVKNILYKFENLVNEILQDNNLVLEDKNGQEMIK